MGWCDIISYLFLPPLIFFMLTDEEMTDREKGISSMFALVCLISAILHAWLLRRHVTGNRNGAYRDKK